MKKIKKLTKKQAALKSEWEAICDKWKNYPRFSSLPLSQPPVEALRSPTSPPPREVGTYPSRSTPGGSTGLPASQQYTGSSMIGVATMHKSNLVPIFQRSDAVEAAKMRRG